MPIRNVALGAGLVAFWSCLVGLAWMHAFVRSGMIASAAWLVGVVVVLAIVLRTAGPEAARPSVLRAFVGGVGITWLGLVTAIVILSITTHASWQANAVESVVASLPDADTAWARARAIEESSWILYTRDMIAPKATWPGFFAIPVAFLVAMAVRARDEVPQDADALE